MKVSVTPSCEGCGPGLTGRETPSLCSRCGGFSSHRSLRDLWYKSACLKIGRLDRCSPAAARLRCSSVFSHFHSSLFSQTLSVRSLEEAGRNPSPKLCGADANRSTVSSSAPCERGDVRYELSSFVLCVC